MNAICEPDRRDARLRRIAGHTSDLVVILDGQGQFLYRASWSNHILGWPVSSGSNLLSFCATSDDAQRASQWLADLGAKGDDQDSSEVVILRMRKFDGGERVCKLIGYSRYDDSLIAGILVHVSDVTELVEAGTHAAVMSGHSSDIVAIVDAASRITWVSPSVERVLGFRTDEITGRSALQLVHPDDQAVILDRLAGVLDSPTAFRPVELRLVRADGVVGWFEISGANLLDDPVVRGIVVSLHDVTERRAAQTALGGVRAAHRSILAMAGDAIMTVGESGAVEDFNRAAADIFGWQADEIIGKQCTVLFDDDVLSDLSARTNAWTESLVDPIEAYAVRRGGQTFPALISVSRIEADGGPLFTTVVRDISERQAIEARLEFVMLHDELTSLPNRRLLIERANGAIERARHRRHHVAVALVDLDEFQRINDDFGLDIGDQVLRHAAEILCDACGRGATVARLAGDQFAILFGDATSIEAVIDAASHIGQCLRSFDADGLAISASASIGIALWSDDSYGVLELLRNAERAMYRCKQQGGARFALYDEAMQNLVTGRRELEAALRDGIAHDELRAFYQPIVRVRDCRVVRFEALVRWDRPTIGIVGPAEFIGIAEQSVLIIELGSWMLHRAAIDCVGWQQRLPGVGITVNVSARHFDEGDIIGDVRAALDSSGLDAKLLCLEVTESVMLADTQHTLAILANLRAMRVSVVLDDFGTGYSSLTYLRRLPIDGLKIDKSFVDTIGTGTEDTTILRAIADLGAAYELEVVAEGIDTGAKLAVLRAIGCRYGQGYLFARPLPLPDALEMWDPS